MRRRFMVLAFLCLAAGTPTASAQESAHVTLSTDADRDWRALAGMHGSLQHLCDHITRAPWAVEYGGFGQLVECELSREVGQGMRALRIHYSGGLRLYLVTGTARALDVVRLLEDVNWLATEGGDAEIVRVGELTTFAGRRVVHVETRGGFIDFDNAEAVGWNRRSITVCVRTAESLECQVQLPLEMEFWSGENQSDRFAPVHGLSVTDRTVAEAIAIVRRNGTVRLRLRRGTWRELYGGDRFNPDASTYPATDSDQVVRFEAEPEPPSRR